MMDAILAAIAKVIEVLFTNPQHIALLVSIAANVAMAWFIMIMRKEDRADGQNMTTALSSLTEAVNKMRIVVAAALRSDDV
jgi:peptidoglycan biosynthesis protein MviN/MurJ (putative lipid II flippase)